MQGILIIIAILIGILIPQAAAGTFLIRYNLMIMLFFVFLDIQLRRDTLQLMHVKVLIANLILPLLLFSLIQFIDIRLATAVFLISAMPTAGVAPIIAGFLGSRVEMVTASILLTSPVIAIVLPFLFGFIGTENLDIPFWKIMLPISIVIFIPLFLGQIVKNLLPKIAAKIRSLRRISFILFLVNVFIASANASAFIQNNQQTNKLFIILIAASIGLICVFNFKVGEILGGAKLKMEASLGLGRKNTMFGVWLALTFFDPLVALGPMFYILFQNAYNSYQIYQFQKINPLRNAPLSNQ